MFIRRLFVMIAALAALAVGGLAGAGTASATAPQFKNVGLGLCLASQGNSSVSGARMVVDTCNTGAASQNWHVRGTTTIDGSFGYQLQNNFSLCLGVAGSSAAVNAAVVQGTCATVGDHSQIWRPAIVRNGRFFFFTSDPGRGQYWFVNGHSGFCLYHDGGARLIQAGCSTTNSQQVWSF